VLRVKPGEKIPVDGSIQEGESTIDESMISGETIPVDKTTGDKVSSGTINGNKTFVMIAEKVGSEHFFHILSKWSILQAGQKLLYRTWLTKFPAILFRLSLAFQLLLL